MPGLDVLHSIMRVLNNVQFGAPDVDELCENIVHAFKHAFQSQTTPHLNLHISREGYKASSLSENIVLKITRSINDLGMNFEISLMHPTLIYGVFTEDIGSAKRILPMLNDMCAFKWNTAPDEKKDALNGTRHVDLTTFQNGMNRISERLPASDAEWPADQFELEPMKTDMDNQIELAIAYNENARCIEASLHFKKKEIWFEARANTLDEMKQLMNAPNLLSESSGWIYGGYQLSGHIRLVLELLKKREMHYDLNHTRFYIENKDNHVLDVYIHHKPHEFFGVCVMGDKENDQTLEVKTRNFEETKKIICDFHELYEHVWKQTYPDTSSFNDSNDDSGSHEGSVNSGPNSEQEEEVAIDDEQDEDDSGDNEPAYPDTSSFNDSNDDSVSHEGSGNSGPNSEQEQVAIHDEQDEEALHERRSADAEMNLIRDILNKNKIEFVHEVNNFRITLPNLDELKVVVPIIVGRKFSFTFTPKNRTYPLETTEVDNEHAATEIILSRHRFAVIPWIKSSYKNYTRLLHEDPNTPAPYENHYINVV